MYAALRRSQDIALVFDSSGAQQDFPMIFDGGVGECGGDDVARLAQERDRVLENASHNKYSNQKLNHYR